MVNNEQKINQHKYRKPKTKLKPITNYQKLKNINIYAVYVLCIMCISKKNSILK